MGSSLSRRKRHLRHECTIDLLRLCLNEKIILLHKGGLCKLPRTRRGKTVDGADPINIPARGVIQVFASELSIILQYLGIGIRELKQ